MIPTQIYHHLYLLSIQKENMDIFSETLQSLLFDEFWLSSKADTQLIGLVVFEEIKSLQHQGAINGFKKEIFNE